MCDVNMSVPLYNYLCSKLGHENDVRSRRLCYTISEYLYPYNTIIPSGSKAEGLDMIESDEDIMFLLKYVYVYEHSTNTMLIDSFMISTEDTAPGYVRLISYGYTTPLLREWCIQQDRNRLLLSNKLFKEYWLFNSPFDAYIHGPCITDPDESVDGAFCIRCTSWIQQAQLWIQRKREWPSPNLIHKIQNFGVFHSRTMLEFFQSNSNQWKCIAIPKIEQMFSQLRIFLFNCHFRTKQHVATLDKLFRLLASYKLKAHKFLYSTLTSMLAKHISWRGTNICKLTNRYFYKRHKNTLPYLLIGVQCDAMSGWLNLATYFYCMKQYRISLYLTVLTLSKCHSNKILSFQCMNADFDRVLCNVEHEAIEYGLMNAYHICKRHLTDDVEFSIFSCIYPFELEMEIRIRTFLYKSPIMYCFFLRFLCLHHLHEHTDVGYALQDLYDLRNYLTRDFDHLDWNIFMGQAHYRLGNFRTALTFFRNVSELEEFLYIFTDVKPLQYKTFATFMINHIQLKL
ncbi:unnamed protein product [Mytilus coruscus]|uniref:Mab-21-like HhH/H2TH-like domain-containing protein n=1 Tax=Mytilus coruscus TaxID=42192 RepID=A0A6J8EL45_MYTCO|nr:unnamed protein product [Mytilus coruscus]